MRLTDILLVIHNDDVLFSSLDDITAAHLASPLDLTCCNVVRKLASETEVCWLALCEIQHHSSQRPCREWVARCLGQMTDSNREDAQAELKQVIAESYGNKTLWTTDWDGLQLKRCVSARHASTPVHS